MSLRRLHDPVRSTLALSGLVGLVLLAGCADSSPAPSPDTQKSRVFDAEARRAARALSLGDSNSLKDVSGPFQKALLCDASLAVVLERIETAKSADQSARQAVRQVKAVYEDRVQTLGQREAKTANEIQSDLAAVRAGQTDLLETSRIAMACIRQLQGGE